METLRQVLQIKQDNVHDFNQHPTELSERKLPLGNEYKIHIFASTYSVLPLLLASF